LSTLSQLDFVDRGALHINPDRKEEAGLQGRRYERAFAGGRPVHIGSLAL
jgi:hypothetical protein